VLSDLIAAVRDGFMANNDLYSTRRLDEEFERRIHLRRASSAPEVSIHVPFAENNHRLDKSACGRRCASMILRWLPVRL
jgi:hypothetical protein